jgi:hypothetical protein
MDAEVIDFLNEIEDKNVRGEIGDIIEYVMQIPKNIISELEGNQNKKTFLCKKIILFMLREKNFTDYLLSEIKLDTGFYYVYNLYVEYTLSFIILNTDVNVMKETIDMFIGEYGGTEEQIVTDIYNNFKFAISNILITMVNMILECSEDFKLSVDEKRMFITMLIEKSLCVSKKYRLTMDDNRTKGEVLYWITDHEGLLKKVDDPIVINFYY